MDFQSIKACTYLPDYLIKHARLLPERDAILPLLPKSKVIVEVGVALGDFSKKFINICQPKKFIAIDTFQIHHQPMLWGTPTKDIFKDTYTHRAYFDKRFANEIRSGLMTVYESDSAIALEKLPDKSIDIVYVDAGHDYASVSKELSIIKRKIKETGHIILNDYTLMDVVLMEPYGVIQAANEFMLEEDWEMLYFAFQTYMFCDVVLRKRRKHAKLTRFLSDKFNLSL